MKEAWSARLITLSLLVFEVTLVSGQNLGEPLPKPLGLQSPAPEAPVIEKHPSSHLVRTENDIVRLSCQAKGYPKPTISWLKDGTQLTNLADRNLVEVSPGELLFIRIDNKGEWPNTGTYQCVARNAVGRAISRNATVQKATIRSDFRREPRDTIGVEGESVTLKCEGPRGIPEPVISWKKDFESISNTNRIQILPNGNLFISKVQKSDSGSYECVASNIAGTKTSTAALLRVQEPLKIRVPFLNPVARVGQSVEIVCSAEGDPRPTIRWTKNGNTLPARFSVSNDGTLRINAVEADDEGDYLCTAENGVERESKSISLTVQTVPQFVSVVPDTTVQVGDTVTLTCRAKGKPQPTIVWRDFRGKEMFVEKSYEDGHMLVDANGDLVIFSVRFTDEGLYRCQAINLAGTITAEVRLSVKPSGSSNPPPILDRVPANRTVSLSTSLVLECASSSNPHPVINWFKDEKPLKTGNRITKMNSGNLNLTNIQASDAGIYTCKASNNYGITEWHAWIEVTSGQIPRDDITVPSPPGKPSVVNSTSSTVTLTWSESNEIPVDHYVIDYYRVESSSTTWEKISRVSEPVYTVTNLLPSSDYIFLIRSVKKHAISNPSQVSESIETKDPVILNPTHENRELNHVFTRIVQAASTETQGFVVSWESNGKCDVIDGFFVMTQPVTLSSEKPQIKQVPCSSRSSELTDVHGKNEVRVRPYKQKWTGPVSPIVFISLPSGIVQPQLPSLTVETNSESKNRVLFRWQAPADLPASYVAGYELLCWSKDGDINRTLNVNASTTQMTLIDLPSAKSYLAAVTYMTHLGKGTTSESEEFMVEVGGDVTSFLKQPGVMAGVIGAAAFVLLLIIGVVVFLVKRRRVCKTGGLHVSRQSSRSPFVSSYGDNLDKASGGHQGSGKENYPNLLPNDGNQFYLERLPMISKNPPSNGKNQLSVTYNKGNGETTSHTNGIQTSVSPPKSSGCSYVTELTSSNYIQKHFARPNVPSPQTNMLQQLHQQSQFNKQRSTSTNIHPADHKIEEIGSSDIRAREHSSPSPPLSQQTGISDKSRSSSGMRSTSDRSAWSGQSSRRLEGGKKVTNQQRGAQRILDVNNRLHGSQQQPENPCFDDNLPPPTPPIREESFHHNSSPSAQYYNRAEPERRCYVPNEKLDHDRMTQLCTRQYVADDNHPRNNVTDLANTWGNGYGSESDIRESSCDRESSYSSDVESEIMESVSQVNQSIPRTSAVLSHYHQTPASQAASRLPLLHSYNSQGPSCGTPDHDLAHRNGPQTDNGRRNTKPNRTATNNSSSSQDINCRSVGSRSLNSDGSGTGASNRSRSEAKSTQFRSAKVLPPTNSLNVAPPSLHLEINNVLSGVRDRSGDCPSPSSPTESAVSEQSGYMSTASSCWQFQAPSPCKQPPPGQLRGAVIGSNGRMQPFSYQRTPDGRSYPSHFHPNDSVVDSRFPNQSINRFPMKVPVSPNSDANFSSQAQS